MCFLSAGAHSRAGWDGVGGFLHCAVCGPGLHWRPVDERLFLFHASPLASHLPLCFQWQRHSWRWYDLTTDSNHNLLSSHAREAHYFMSRNISLQVSTLQAVIHSYQPSPMTCSVFSSSPANRLQLSLSLSHSFSNGKTCEFVDLPCMGVPLRRHK